MPLANAAKALILIAAFLAAHGAQAVDQAAGLEPAPSARSEPDAAPPAPDGAELFRTHCAMCHKPAEPARRLHSAPDPAVARADMAAFLARHGRSDASTDDAIIEYLASSSFR